MTLSVRNLYSIYLSWGPIHNFGGQQNNDPKHGLWACYFCKFLILLDLLKGGAWLAPSVGPMTLDLRVMCSSPVWGEEMT